MNNRIDLNLLRVFHAIMTERSVTLAARRLSMTQPAVSNALRRLRAALSDPLFVKSAHGVQPTRKAREIWPQLHDSLEQIQHLVAPPDFEPGTTKLAFSVAITDSLASTLVCPLALLFAHEAPNATLRFRRHDNNGSTADLEAGRLDCAIGMFPAPPADLHASALLTDDYLCVVAINNRLSRGRLTLEAYMRAQHVLTKSAGTESGIVDSWLDMCGLKRRIAIVVNHFAEALTIVEQSHFVTALPQRFLIASSRAKPTFRTMPLPFDTEKIVYKMLWHERCHRVRSQVWLRDLIKRTIQTSFQLTKR